MNVVNNGTVERQLNIDTNNGDIYSHKPTYWENLFNRLKEQMSSEIRYHEIIEDLVEYRTKLDGTKGLEEKLRDGNIPARMILKALRQKDKYAKKADKFSCYEAAQQIDLQLFSRLLIRQEKSCFLKAAMLILSTILLIQFTECFTTSLACAI